METDNTKRTRGFTKIETILPFHAKERHLEEVYVKQHILHLWEAVLDNFLPDAKELSKAIDFEKGKLIIACLSEEIAYTIKSMTEKILSLINELFGKQVVYTLSVEF